MRCPQEAPGLRLVLFDEHDVQDARAVDSFDSFELDVASRARAGDPGERLRRADLGSHPSHRFGDVVDDLIGPDDAHVQVGHQRQRPAALIGAMVEHDRAGCGDADRRRRDHGLDLVEFRVGQLVVTHLADLCG